MLGFPSLTCLGELRAGLGSQHSLTNKGTFFPNILFFERKRQHHRLISILHYLQELGDKGLHRSESKHGLLWACPSDRTMHVWQPVSSCTLCPSLGVRMRGAPADIDPLNKVPFKRARSRVKKGPL